MRPKGKCPLRDAWLSMTEFRQWLAAVPVDKFKVRCTLCRTNFDIFGGGITSVKIHARLKKHSEAVSSSTTSITVDRFFLSESLSSGGSGDSSSSLCSSSGSASSPCTAPTQQILSTSASAPNTRYLETPVLILGNFVQPTIVNMIPVVSLSHTQCVCVCVCTSYSNTSSRTNLKHAMLYQLIRENYFLV